jgi:hypothetical protein
MSELPETENEQCTECKKWGGIYFRSGVGEFPVRLCYPCFGKYVSLSPEGAHRYRKDLYQKLLLELTPPIGNA